MTSTLRVFTIMALVGWLGALTVWANPSILHQPSLSTLEGQPIEVMAMVSDPAAPLVQVRLYYRSAGTTAYQMLIMNGSGYNYAAQIPGSVVLASGVDYYIEALDQTGQTALSPMVNANLAPYHVSTIRRRQGPGLEFLSPGNGAVVTPDDALIVIAVHAAASPLDEHSIQVLFDEKDLSQQAQISSTLISLVLPEPLSEGLHGLRIRVRDREGQSSESPTWSFTVRRTRPGVTSVKPESEVHLTGNLTAESQWASLTQRPQDAAYLSQPEGFLNRLGMNLSGRLGDTLLTGSATLSSEEKPGRQPVDRFRLEASNDFMQLMAGDVYPVFSTLTMNNTFLRGGQLLLTTGRPGAAYSQLQVAAGISHYPVEGRYLQPGTFEQWLGGVRWIHDFSPGIGLALNYDTINDYAQSIQNPANAMPADNHAVSGELHVRVPITSEVAAGIFGEYGGSYYDREQNVTTCSVGSAGRAGLRLEWGGRSQLEVEYKHIGANYVTLANPWLIGDWDGVTAHASWYLFNDDLAVMAQLDNWHDNLEGQKTIQYLDANGITVTAGTTRTLFWSGSLNYRLAAFLPSLNLGYSVNQQRDDAQPWSVINNLTSVLNAGLGAQWPLSGWGQLVFNTSYSRTGFQDLAEKKISPEMLSSAWMSSLRMLLTTAWVIEGGWGLTRNQTDASQVFIQPQVMLHQNLDYRMAHLRTVWKMVPGTWAANAAWENTTGQDDQSLVNDTLSRILVGGTWTPVLGQALNLTLSKIDYTNQLASAKSFQEWVTNLSYSLRF